MTSKPNGATSPVAQDLWVIENDTVEISFPIAYAKTAEEALDFALANSNLLYEWQRPSTTVTKKSANGKHS